MILVLEWKEASKIFAVVGCSKCGVKKSGVFWQQNYKSWNHTTTLPVYSFCADAFLNPQYLFSLDWETVSLFQESAACGFVHLKILLFWTRHSLYNMGVQTDEITVLMFQNNNLQLMQCLCMTLKSWSGV